MNQVQAASPAQISGIARSPIPLGVALAFTAGFADASSFVGAGGIFSAHVTGNFVVFAADIALHAHADRWLALATFPTFVLAVLAATLLHRRLPPEPAPDGMRLFLAINSALFAVAAAIGSVADTSSPGLARTAIVALLVIAMGIQNAMHRLRPSLGPMTTVMTGNVTQWFVESLDPSPSGVSSKRRLLCGVLVAFALGCTSGALGVVRWHFSVLVVPMVVTLLARSLVTANQKS